MTNEPILQCIIVLKPGLFVTGFIQNERKLSSSGSFSFSSWHTNSLLVLAYFWVREREAVDSEFQMALPSDYNKKQQLLGSIAARPEHPWASSCAFEKGKKSRRPRRSHG